LFSGLVPGLGTLVGLTDFPVGLGMVGFGATGRFGGFGLRGSAKSPPPSGQLRRQG
jgi:hypothetical protein